MKYLSSIDLNKNQLLQARIENLAAFPGTPVLGQIFYHTGDATIYQYDNVGPSGGGGWSSLASDGITNLDYTAATTNGIVTSDTGDNATILAVDGTNAGLMLPADFTKLGTIATGAEVNVATNIEQGTRTATTVPVTSSTGTNATLAEATTLLAGVLSAAKWNEIVANTNKVSDINHNTITNITVVEAPTNVDIQSSDGSNDTIAAADGTNAGVMTTAMYDEHVINNGKVSYPGSSILLPYQLLSEKDAVSGYAGLDGTGKINPLQLPALAISETFVVATQVAQLALTVQEGDIAVRTDESKSYIALNDNNGTMADWQELLTPTDAVQSVFGRSGVVTAQSGDYDADQITETATRVFVTPALKTAITHSNRASLDLVTGTNTGNEIQSTTTVKGIAELATQTEVNTGSDNLRIVTPLTLATRLSSAITATKYAANIGDAAATSFTITNATHALGTSGDFIVQVREVSTGDIVIVDTNTNATTGTVVLTFNVAPTLNQFRVVIKS